jgi:excisionase family DNA binding protein
MKWYSVTEAAKELGVSDETIRRHIQNGRLPGAKRKSPVPRSPYVIPETAIKQFNNSRKLN